MPIRKDNRRQRCQIDPEGIDNNVRTIVPVLGKIIRTASGHVALRHITIPADHRQYGPYHAHTPDERQAAEVIVIGFLEIPLTMTQ